MGLCDFQNSEFDSYDILEFGCYKATSINYFSTKLPDSKYGFDSFQGLPMIGLAIMSERNI